MYKIYFRQAIYMLKQNAFMSVIAILGTAMAIMMIMAIIVSDEIKSVNIAPESNRSRTLYIPFQSRKDSTRNSSQSDHVTYEIVHEYLPRLQKPVYTAAVSCYIPNMNAIASLEGTSNYTNIILRAVNASYWKVFDFDFIAGKPFVEEEVSSGIANAVISEKTARKLFNDLEAVGKTIEINLQPYHITGIVKDVSPVFNDACGDVWVPYTSNEEYSRLPYKAILMGESEKDFPEIIAEVRECEKMYGAEKAPWMLYLVGPVNRKIHNMELDSISAKELEGAIKEQQRKRVFILVILLLVPAINLSGLSLSRVKKRMGEIGVRKAFGAKKYVILTQVLYENLITSLIGGVIGLIFSYIVVFWMREWLLGIPVNSPIPISSLISPVVFIGVFVACILINLLSAGLPALKASRMTIVNSLNQNDKES